jgi:hypothetical protein
MAQYMLLLRDDPAVFRDLSPDEMQRIIEKYRAWGQKLREAGLLVGSHKLKGGEGRILGRERGQVRILDGPFSEAKEVLGGYFLIEAASYEQALERSRDCPHLEFGSIEIRAIDSI